MCYTIFFTLHKQTKERKKEKCTQQPYLVNERSNEYHALIMYKLNINLFNKLINVKVELKHNVLYTGNKHKNLKKNNIIKIKNRKTFAYKVLEKCPRESQNSLIWNRLCELWMENGK